MLILTRHSRKAFSFPDHNISAEIVIHEFTKCPIHYHVSHSIASDQGTHFIANKVLGKWAHLHRIHWVQSLVRELRLYMPHGVTKRSYLKS